MVKRFRYEAGKHQDRSRDCKTPSRDSNRERAHQRKLAKLSGVGSGTISLIEAGATQPSVALLKRILHGADVSLAYFFSFDLQDETKVFFRADEHRDLGSSRVSYRLIAGERQDRKLQMLIEEYAPGTDSGRSDLSHKGEECAVVLSGHLEVTVDGKPRYSPPETPITLIADYHIGSEISETPLARW